MTFTFTEYLKNFADYHLAVVSPDIDFSNFYLVGGAARNYLVANMSKSKKIKAPKDIDIITTNKSAYERIRDLYTTNPASSNNRGTKFTFKTGPYIFDIDLWYVPSVTGYVTQVFTAADGIALGDVWSGKLKEIVDDSSMFSNEFMDIDIHICGLTKNHVIDTRKTTRIDFSFEYFKKHCQNQGLYCAWADEPIRNVYERLAEINNIGVRTI